MPIRLLQIIPSALAGWGGPARAFPLRGFLLVQAGNEGKAVGMAADRPPPGLLPQLAPALDATLGKAARLIGCHAKLKASRDDRPGIERIVGKAVVTGNMHLRGAAHFPARATAFDTASLVLGADAFVLGFSFLGFFSSRLRLFMPLAMVWLL